MYRPYPMRWLRLAAILCALSCLHISVFAQCGFIPLSLQQKTTAASAIARVKISAAKTFVGNKGYVYTQYTASVKAWLKKGGGSTINLQMTGGIFENRATVVSGSVMLQAGGEYILFLKEERKLLGNKKTNPTYELISPVQGALQSTDGHYYDPIHKNVVSEAKMFAAIAGITKTAARTPGGAVYKAAVAQQPLAVQSISSFTTGAAISGSVLAADHLKIYGTGFGTTTGQVAFANADDGGATQITPFAASDYISWTDTYIEVKIPSDAGNGTFYVIGPTTQASPAPLNINYAINTIYSGFYNYSTTTRQRPKLLNQNNSGGYSLIYHTDFAANTAAIAAFGRALNHWQCTSGVNFTQASSTTTSQAANDGVNVVQFETATTPLGVGTLGVAITNYSGGAVPGFCEQQNTVWYVRDIDIVFSDVPYPGYSWQYGSTTAAASQFDFESVALHEVGHAHGLGHVIAPGQVMHYALANGQTSRTLSTYDVNGGRDMVAYSASACANPAGYFGGMTAVPCTLPLQFLSFEGTKNNNGTNQLQWTTENEQGNKGFWIQRSAISNNNFEAIGFVPAAHLNNTGYNFTDAAAGVRSWLYRLKQVDEMGQYTYSSVVRIEGVTEKALVWSSGKTITVQLPQTTPSAVLQLYTADGRLINTQVLQGGENRLPVRVSGIIHYILTANSRKQKGKLFIQ